MSPDLFVDPALTQAHQRIRTLEYVIAADRGEFSYFVERIKAQRALLDSAAATMRVIATDSDEPGEKEAAREWLDHFDSLTRTPHG